MLSFLLIDVMQL